MALTVALLIGMEFGLLHAGQALAATGLLHADMLSVGTARGSINGNPDARRPSDCSGKPHYGTQAEPESLTITFTVESDVVVISVFYGG